MERTNQKSRITNITNPQHKIQESSKVEVEKAVKELKIIKVQEEMEIQQNFKGWVINISRKVHKLILQIWNEKDIPEN